MCLQSCPPWSLHRQPGRRLLLEQHALAGSPRTVAAEEQAAGVAAFHPTRAFSGGESQRRLHRGSAM